MRFCEVFEQIAIFSAKELETEIIIKDASRAHDSIDFKVELSVNHFPRKFENGEKIILFFKDATLGMLSDWRKKESVLGVEAKVFYVLGQKIPVVITLGTTYEKNTSREFIKYLPQAIESGCGRYDLILRKIISA
jgi:hypothetical protein